MYTVDYVKIQHNVENGIQPEQNIICQMYAARYSPSQDTHNIYSVAAKQLNPSVCQDVLHNGFPFSNEDIYG